MSEEIDNSNKIEKRMKKSLVTFLIIVGLVIIFGLFAIWYFSNNHSIYAKLTKATYTQGNNVNSAFLYPKVMSFNSTLVNALAKKASGISTPLVYTYNIPHSKQVVEEAYSYFSLIQIEKTLNLDTSHLLNQIKIKSGNYITFITQKNPSTYNDLYGNCTNYITNINNQTSLILYS